MAGRAFFIIQVPPPELGLRRLPVAVRRILQLCIRQRARRVAPHARAGVAVLPVVGPRMRRRPAEAGPAAQRAGPGQVLSTPARTKVLSSEREQAPRGRPARSFCLASKQLCATERPCPKLPTLDCTQRVACTPTRPTLSLSSLISGSACTVLLLNLRHSRPVSASKARTKALTAAGSPAAWASSPHISSKRYERENTSGPHGKHVQATSSSGLETPSKGAKWKLWNQASPCPAAPCASYMALPASNVQASQASLGARHLCGAQLLKGNASRCPRARASRAISLGRWSSLHCSNCQRPCESNIA